MSDVTFQGIGGDPGAHLINTECKRCGKTTATRAPIIFCSVACYQADYMDYITAQKQKARAALTATRATAKPS